MATVYIVTDQDIEIRFPGDEGESWAAACVVSITYSPDRVGAHNPTTRLGGQVWEGLLQADEPLLGKAVMAIDVTSLPDPNRRTMEFHFRVRVADTSPEIVTEWSESRSVRIIGRPGRPSKTGWGV